MGKLKKIIETVLSLIIITLVAYVLGRLFKWVGVDYKETGWFFVVLVLGVSVYGEIFLVNLLRAKRKK